MPPRVKFEVFEPKAESDVGNGTVSRAKASCLCCRGVLSPERVRSQLAAQRGGADTIFDDEGNRTGGALISAVVTLQPKRQGRHYRLPTDRDYIAVHEAQKRVARVIREWNEKGGKDPSPLPDEPTPKGGGSGAGRAFGVQTYGIFQWGDMFTARQKLGLRALGGAIVKERGTTRPISLAIGKLADLANAFCPWEPKAECPRNVLSQGRLKPGWDFAEGVVTSDASGGFMTCVENLARGVQSTRGVHSVGQSGIARSPKLSSSQ